MFDNERCFKCDSRYCGSICYADAPGFVYVTGNGYVTFEQAAEVEAKWTASGFEHGIDHGFRRVEWDSAVPHPDDTVDAVRIAALQREHAAERYGLHETAMLYGFTECG